MSLFKFLGVPLLFDLKELLLDVVLENLALNDTLLLHSLPISDLIYRILVWLNLVILHSHWSVELMGLN